MPGNPSASTSCAITPVSSVIPEKLSGISLRYLKNRISVPRDMPIISARLLRQSLNKIESLSDINEIDKIPFRHRYDQDPINFISSY